MSENLPNLEAGMAESEVQDSGIISESEQIIESSRQELLAQDLEFDTHGTHLCRPKTALRYVKEKFKTQLIYELLSVFQTYKGLTKGSITLLIDQKAIDAPQSIGDFLDSGIMNAKRVVLEIGFNYQNPSERMLAATARMRVESAFNSLETRSSAPPYFKYNK